MNLDRWKNEYQKYMEAVENDSVTLEEHKKMAAQMGKMIEEFEKVEQDSIRKRPARNPNRKPTQVDMKEFSARIKRGNAEKINRLK